MEFQIHACIALLFGISLVFIPKDGIDNNKIILMGAISVEQVNILSYRGLKIILLQLLSHFRGANEKIQFAVSNP